MDSTIVGKDTDPDGWTTEIVGKADADLEELEAEAEALNKRAADTLANACDHMERAADMLANYGMTEEAARQRHAANECRSIIHFLSSEH